MRPVYVRGVGLHPFGRFADRTLTALGVDAVRAAMSDAGVGRGEFQAAFCGTVYGGVATGHKVLTALGLSGVPIVNVEAGCASGGAALSLAAAQVASGQHDTVLVLGVEKMPRGMIRSSFFDPWREEAGLAATPAYFALRAQRLMLESDVADARPGGRIGEEPPARRRQPERHVPQGAVDSTRSSRRRSCARRCDCSCCARRTRAPRRWWSRPCRMRRRRSASRPPRCARTTPARCSASTRRSAASPATAVPTPTEMAARAAYEEAGLGPGDLDVAEVQDTDAAREILSVEELGLCPRRGGGRWVRDGGGTMGSSLPVNPSGGLLSKGEPLGASALGQVVELTWQLRGAAGPRQVAGARVALAHTVGRGANACVTILQR